jgi:hypothetical protein
MLTKYVTYEINPDINSYGQLASLFEELGAQKLTESTYRIESKIKLDDLCERLKAATYGGDHVFVLFGVYKGVEHRVVR